MRSRPPHGDFDSLQFWSSIINKKNRTPIRINLTAEQKEKLRELTGKEFKALEFSAMELEERIAPALTRN